MPPTHSPAPLIHLIERVRSPETAYAAVRASAPTGSLLLDLSSGRLDGVSKLDSTRLPGGGAFTWLKASDFAHDLADVTRAQYIQWIAEAGDLDLVDGASIKELFTYKDELSLWWITQAAQKDQDNSPYRWFFFAFAVIDRLLETGRVAPGAEWHLWVRGEQTGEVLASAIGERGRVVVHTDRKRPNPRGLWRLTRRHLLGPARQIASALRLSAATRHRRASGDAGELLGSSRPKVLVVTSYSRSWKAISDEERFSEEVSAFDYYLGTMPWDLQKKGLGVAWLTAPLTLQEYTRWVQEGVEKQTLPDATPWAYLDGKGARALLSHHVRWLLEYHRLFVELGVQDRWQYNGIPLGHWIVRDYRNLLMGWANALLIQYEQQKNAASILKPDAVVYRDEMYVSGRIVSAAVQGQARRIGVQHGIINSEATVYTLSGREVDSDTEHADLIQTCPVPDAFASFGDYTREFLDRIGGYDPSRVFPTGGVRHDELVRRFMADGVDRAVQRESLRKQLGLPVDRRIVLLCTQRRAEAGEWFDLVVGGLKEGGEEAFVAVKTHHYHGGESLIERVAERHGWSDYAFYKDHTYSLIRCADVVVGGPSTIILESRLLNVPTVSISGAGDYEVYPYLQDSVGEVVHSRNDMADVLSRLLHSRAENARDQQARRKILKRHLWNDDAGACDRLAELIADQVYEGKSSRALMSMSSP